MSEGRTEGLVSIVIPMYNESNNIRNALVSLVRQSYQNIEFIIVDDGSRDESIEVAKRYLSKSDVQYTILENTTNVGQTFSENRGAIHSNGEYVLFHDADDLSTPDRISKQVTFLEENPSVGVVGGAYFYINENRGQREVKVRPTSDESIRSGMGRECMINAGTAMFRSEALFETNLFQSNHVEGYEVLIEVGTKWKFANLADPIYVYQINDSSRSQSNQLLKKTTIAYRSYQAVKKLNLPFWNVPLQVGWLIYMNAPPAVQKGIRTIFSPTEDRSLTDEEVRTIEELQNHE